MYTSATDRHISNHKIYTMSQKTGSKKTEPLWFFE